MPPAAGILCLAPSIITSEGALVCPLLASGTIDTTAVPPLLSVTAVHRTGLRAILRAPAAAPRAVPELASISTGKVLPACFGAPTESLARLRISGCSSVELLGRALVPVRHSLAVFRIVLPFAPAALAGRYLVLVIAPVYVVVDIRVSIDVDTAERALRSKPEFQELRRQYFHLAWLRAFSMASMPVELAMVSNRISGCLSAISRTRSRWRYSSERRCRFKGKILELNGFL
jgi:hypothetical protein